MNTENDNQNENEKIEDNELVNEEIKEIKEEVKQKTEDLEDLEDTEVKEDKDIKKSITVKGVLSSIVSLLLCLAVAAAINTFVLINARIPTPSMESTIMTEDRVFGNRLAYMFNDPERGDVVVFIAPDEPEKKYVKRVIGIPGDKVEIIEGQLFVNDELIDEPYLNEEMIGSFGVYYVPEDNYFVLGDNRNHSWDARMWINTYVPKDTILGEAMVVYFPTIHAIR